jgi:hypothetical protein
MIEVALIAVNAEPRMILGLNVSEEYDRASTLRKFFGPGAVGT